MANTNSIALVAGGLAVVVLSFGAGLLGGSLSTPPDGPSGDVPAAAADSATKARVAELDRRLVNVEERMRVIEETANAALQRAQAIDGLRREIEALKTGNTFRVPDVPPMAKVDEDATPHSALTPEERAQRDQERAAQLRESMMKIAKKNGAALFKHRLSVWADTTDQGDADRRSQVFADARLLAQAYQLKGAQEDTVREILLEEVEATTRQVGPLLSGGIEKADYSLVKPKLEAIWAQRDTRLRELLDEDDYERYAATQKEWRKIWSGTMDTLDEERLAQR